MEVKKPTILVTINDRLSITITKEAIASHDSDPPVWYRRLQSSTKQEVSKNFNISTPASGIYRMGIHLSQLGV